MRKLYVDKNECTSCAQCADNLPEVFFMDENDFADVREGYEASDSDIQEEIDACPGECIHWREV